MKKIAPDKWKHFFAGIVMGILLQSLALYFLYETNMHGYLYVLILVVIISYGFELFSKITGKGHHDINDAIASIIGGVLGAVMVIGLSYLS